MKTLFSCLAYQWAVMMQVMGFRRVWYFPSKAGLSFPVSDFWRWEYRPCLPAGTYNGESGRFISAEP